MQFSVDDVSCNDIEYISKLPLLYCNLRDDREPLVAHCTFRKSQAFPADGFYRCNCEHSLLSCFLFSNEGYDKRGDRTSLDAQAASE